MNLPCFCRVSSEDLIFFEMSCAYILLSRFLNGVMSIVEPFAVSTPSVTAMYRTLCSGK